MCSMLPLASLLLRDRSGRCRCFNVVAYCCAGGGGETKQNCALATLSNGCGSAYYTVCEILKDVFCCVAFTFMRGQLAKIAQN